MFKFKVPPDKLSIGKIIYNVAYAFTVTLH